ncbi:hypothetical protein FDP41_006486 [Naegleria fowleri]|uniref:G8 domain-containing protein n=1 Tax=Naegleria fowleri TaxID=5763 RepID=A0A6A5BK84_NAEFO|nr:uncharacterized protein FDP41_006486 [Naegleria fowleri]KAF0974454.1 hypothetical protein FDP41_006486 [Naegleria fowleri]
MALQLTLLFASYFSIYHSNSLFVHSKSTKAFYADFDVTKLPNGAIYPDSPLFANIFFKNGTMTQFAKDFAANKYVWNEDFCLLDSDGDGLTNGDELGDPCCYWSSGNPASRRYLLSELSDPSDNSSIANFASATNVSVVEGLVAIPTHFSIELKWKLSNDTTNLVCYYQIQMSTLNALGYTTVMYKTHNANSYTRYNLDQNTTYSFRILPYNKFKGYSWYGVGKQSIIFAKTSVDPYGQGIGDDCPSNVITWSELSSNQTIFNFTSQVIVTTTTNFTVCTNQSSVQQVNVSRTEYECQYHYFITECTKSNSTESGLNITICNTTAVTVDDLCDWFYDCEFPCDYNTTENCTTQITNCDEFTYQEPDCINTTITRTYDCFERTVNTTRETNTTSIVCSETSISSNTSRNVFTIPNNYTVILDTSSPMLQDVQVFGCLIFSDEIDIEMHFETMVVTGLLQIGNETHPYKHNATITLHGQKNEFSEKGLGNKNIAITSGGVLSLHGKPHQITWTLLQKTTKVGDTIISVIQDTMWDVGDEIVLASTDYDMNQAERRTIIRRFNGTTFELHTPLLYSHYADTEYYTKSNGTVVEFDQRGEVGLLTHNIRIQGDQDSDFTLFGGHTIYMKTSKYIKLNNVEFRRMGQAGVLGRYPVHFHMFGNASTSYIKKLSIHDTYQRAVTFHGVHGLHAEGIVAYNNFGHAFFLEDAVEEGNLIENCLGLVTKAIPDSRAILTPTNFDSSPATFWMTNPNNILINNRAAGSAGSGIWYQLEPYSLGPNMSPYIQPRKWYWGKFFNNTVHSNAIHGLNLWHDFFVCTDPRLEIFKGIYCGTKENPWAVAEFTKLVSFRNRQQGQFAYVQGDIRMKDSIYADNPIGYTFNVIHQDSFTVKDCIFIGESNNRGNTNNCQNGCYRCGNDYKNLNSTYNRSFANYRSQPIVGIQFHRDGKPLLLDGVEFFNYVDNCDRRANALDIKNDVMAQMEQGDYKVKNLKFHNSNILYLLVGKSSYLVDNYKHAIIIDLDGCLSNSLTLPSGFNPINARIIPANLIMVNFEKCFYVNVWNAYICDQSVNWSNFDVTTPAITNSVDSTRVNSTNGFYEDLQGQLTSGGEWRYRGRFLDNSAFNYTFEWLGKVGTPEKINLIWKGTNPITLTLKITMWGPVSINIVTNKEELILSPSNRTDGSATYNCKTNTVSLTVQSSSTLFIKDATYVPPELDCITFDNSLCSNFSNCGGPKRGKCVGLNECVCRWGWTESDCSTYHCAHRDWCGGHGTCIGPNICRCFPGFAGTMCNKIEEFELFNRVLAFGDIHIRTLDNQNYTFNSVGEFYLYKSQEFSLQGRLKQCTPTSKTSCMKAISFSNGNDTVVVTSDGKSKVLVYVNQALVDLSKTTVNMVGIEQNSTFKIPSNLQTFYDQIKYQRDPDTNEIPVLPKESLQYKPPAQAIYVLNGGATIVEEQDTSNFVYSENGTVIPFNVIVIKFSVGFKGQIRLKNDGVGWLSVSFSPSKDTNYTGSERGGLYGTLDSNPNNEFTLRNGFVLTTPSALEVHSIFGESWRVPKTESKFFYTPPESYESLNPTDFVPAMTATTDNKTLQELAERVCSNLGLTAEFYESCLFDVIQTGDVEFAKASAGAAAQDQCETNSTACQTFTCPNFCNLHGKCTTGKCYCEIGWTGDDCGTVSNILQLIGIIIGSILGSICVILCLCVCVSCSLYGFSKRQKRIKRFFRMVSIVPTQFNKEDELTDMDFDVQNIHMSDPNYGELLFTKKR